MPTTEPNSLEVGDLLVPPWPNEPSPATVVCPRGECNHRTTQLPEQVHVKHEDAEWYIVLDDRLDVHVCDDECEWPPPGHRRFNSEHSLIEYQARQQGVSLADIDLSEEG